MAVEQAMLAGSLRLKNKTLKERIILHLVLLRLEVLRRTHSSMMKS